MLVTLDNELFFLNNNQGFFVFHHMNSGKDIRPEEFKVELRMKAQLKIAVFLTKRGNRPHEWAF